LNLLGLCPGSNHVYTGIQGQLVKELERKVFKTLGEVKDFVDK
jgi:hypothetical protein